MRKSIYGLMLIGSLFLSFPLLAQVQQGSPSRTSGEQETLSALSDHLESLEAKLNKNQENFVILSTQDAKENSFAPQKASLEKAEESLFLLREELSALSATYETSLSGDASSTGEEEYSLSVQSLENRAKSLEQEMDSLALVLENESANALTSVSGEKIDLEVVPYVYQEFENGFIVEMKLPTVDAPQELKEISQTWLDYSIKRSEEVKKLGIEQNKQKPSSPQYLWLASYNQFYNEELNVTSFVVTFYEYTGTLPGAEKTEARLVKNDGTMIHALDLLTPSQIAYVQETLTKQVKEDVARPESDMAKKQLKNAPVDLKKAAVFFSEDSLEIHFATGDMNTKLGRPAILNLPLKDILAR